MNENEETPVATPETPAVVTEPTPEVSAEQKAKDDAFERLKEVVKNDPMKAAQFLEMVKRMKDKATLTANQIRHLGPIHENQKFCRKRCPLFKKDECWRKTAQQQLDCLTTINIASSKMDLSTISKAEYDKFIIDLLHGTNEA